MLTQMNPNLSCLESIRKHLLDDDSEIFPECYQNPSSFSSFNVDYEPSLHNDSVQSSLNMKDLLNDQTVPSLHLDDWEICSFSVGISDQDLAVTNSSDTQNHTPQNPTVISMPEAANTLVNVDFSAEHIVPYGCGAPARVENSFSDDRTSKISETTVLPLTAERMYRGVRRRAGGRFTAEIRSPKKKGSKLWLGTYKTAEEAAMAYDQAAYKHRGSQALVNFPHLIRSYHENPIKYSRKRHRAAKVRLLSSSSSESSATCKRKKSKPYVN